ncbi:MAG TPA: sigma-70 family RNA polymerase sigma factor [Streptosporangiaceae bacterium]|nr:sigma-70 family RNA polymerase sigma factor [Streptosporangiaceae bacterium]
MWERAGFEEFYQANYGRMVALVTAVTGDRVEAEDVVQDAFARALTRWNRLGGYDLPEAWVRRVSLRLAIDSGRRLRRVVRVTARLAAQRPAPPPPPEDSLGFTDLGRALRELPLRHREVLVLYYLADLSVGQIAAERGLPPGTVKTRLAAARRRLERELAERSEAVRDAG